MALRQSLAAIKNPPRRAEGLLLLACAVPVYGLKATYSLLFRPSALKLPTPSSNSSTMSGNDARRNSLFAVLVACPAEPTAAETGGHEQDRSKRKVFAASQL